MKKIPIVIFVINLFAFVVFSQASAAEYLKKSRELENKETSPYYRKVDMRRKRK